MRILKLCIRININKQSVVNISNECLSRIRDMARHNIIMFE